MKHLFSVKAKNAKEDVFGYKCFLGYSGCWGSCSGKCFGACNDTCFGGAKHFEPIDN